LKGLRKFGVNDACPECRAPLPRGPAATYDEAVRLTAAADGTVDARLRRRRYAEAVVLLRQALAEDSSQAGYHFLLGYALQHGEANVDGAEVAYRAAISIDPKHAGALCGLGVLLQTERKDIDGAEEAFRAAIAADPADANSHGALGQLLLEQRGAFAEAEALLRRSIELKFELAPHAAHAHVCLGVALSEQGDLAGAEAAWRHALAIDPADTSAQKNLHIGHAGQRRDQSQKSLKVRHYNQPT
jgi:superkiller protein 3